MKKLSADALDELYAQEQKLLTRIFNIEESIAHGIVTEADFAEVLIKHKHALEGAQCSIFLATETIE